MAPTGGRGVVLLATVSSIVTGWKMMVVPDYGANKQIKIRINDKVYTGF